MVGIARRRSRRLRMLRPEGRFLVIESETGGAHGLDRRGADELAERVIRAGFDHTSVTVERHRLVVSGTVPTA